jgi:hypothetical protein
MTTINNVPVLMCRRLRLLFCICRSLLIEESLFQYRVENMILFNIVYARYFIID